MEEFLGVTYIIVVNHKLFGMIVILVSKYAMNRHNSLSFKKKEATIGHVYIEISK